MNKIAFKKYLLFMLVLLLCLTGCIKKNNPNTKLELDLKTKLIEENYLDEKNFSSLKIIETLEHGYYKKFPEKIYTEVHFTYKCKDKTNACIHDILTDTGKYYVLWTYKDSKKIYELSKGISIDYKDVENGNYIKIVK